MSHNIGLEDFEKRLVNSAPYTYTTFAPGQLENRSFLLHNVEITCQVPWILQVH